MLLRVIGFSLMYFCFANCTPSQAPDAEQDQTTGIHANQDTLQRVSGQTGSAAGKEAVKTVREVTISVVYRNSYCGGARPSKEVLDMYNTEYPLINSTILLKDPDGNHPVELSTDHKGVIHAKLKPGTYYYYMTEKYDRDMGCSFVSSCKKWLDRCFGSLIIKKGQVSGYLIVFAYGCNPCDQPKP